MLTKTSYSSPLTYGTTLGSPEESENILNEAAAESVTTDNESSAASTASKLAGKINPVTGALIGAYTTGIKEGWQDVNTLKQVDPGATKRQKVDAAIAGFGEGVFGKVFGIDAQLQDKAIRDHEAKIDSFMAEKSALTMKKPKALTQMQGTVAHNMSAKQYNKALQMKEISGASTIPTRLL